MLQAKEEQARQGERVQRKPVNPLWRMFGLGVMGCAVGFSIGSGRGSGVLFGAIGLVIGIAIAALLSRRPS